jgi:SAM-dependent methyltransferase
VIQRSRLERKVRLAVAAAEYLNGHRLRRVLDVGCGEAPWRGVLRRLRPSAAYTGVDSSPYVVERFGRSRNIRFGTLGRLARLGLEGPYDLIVCADVLHYLPEREVAAGLRAIARLLGGVAFIETYTADDATIGDEDEFATRRTPAYRRLIVQAGLVHLGLHCFAGHDLAPLVTAFERGALSR